MNIMVIQNNCQNKALYKIVRSKDRQSLKIEIPLSSFN